MRLFHAYHRLGTAIVCLLHLQISSYILCICNCVVQCRKHTVCSVCHLSEKG